ncbi:MAG: hypothetical protein KC535_02870 [Nanoarchaeota archaeon]|nr:hypothetical protein [Nanoarchaeota archaeon]
MGDGSTQAGTSFLKKRKRAFFNFFLASVIALGGPSAGNIIFNDLFPSQQRKDFKKEFGFDLHGWRKDIEEQPTNLRTLVLSLQKERLIKPFSNMKEARIVPREFWKQSLWEKIPFHFVTGQYFSGNLLLLPNKVLTFHQVFHELSHEKYNYSTLDYFAQGWPATDNNLTRPDFMKYFEHYIISEYILHKLDSKESQQWLEETGFSFVSKYATTSFYEDVAETAKTALSDPLLIGKLVREQPESDLSKKYEILVKDSLVSGDLVDLSLTMKLYDASLVQKVRDLETGAATGISPQHEYLRTFFVKAKSFLIENPQSVYTGTIATLAGLAYEKMCLEDAAITYYHLALEAPYKDAEYYALALKRLGVLEDESYTEAYQRYVEGYEAADIPTLIYGTH